MADARARHQVEHALHQPVAGAQDRDEAQLLALDGRRVIVRQRRFDGFEGQRQVACHLVAQQQRNLAQQLAEPAVEVALRRMIDSLCWTSGWSMTVTPSSLALLIAAPLAD